MFAEMLDTAISHSPCLGILAVIAWYMGMQLNSHRKALDQHRAQMNETFHRHDKPQPPPPAM